MNILKTPTYLGGTQNEYMVKSSYTGDDKLFLTFTSTSEDFPVTIKYAEKDSTNINTLVKFDMNNSESKATSLSDQQKDSTTPERLEVYDYTFGFSTYLSHTDKYASGFDIYTDSEGYTYISGKYQR